MARSKGGLIGMDAVLKRLDYQVRGIVGRSERGLLKAAIFIRRDMEHSPPTIPIDWGNLRASWYIVTNQVEGESGGSFVEGEGADTKKLASDHKAAKGKSKGRIQGRRAVGMGFSANYAAAVHEDTKAKRKKVGSGAGFFRSALSRNTGTIVRIIARDAKLKRR